MLESPALAFVVSVSSTLRTGELGRPLTEAERLLVALLSSPPTNMLTLQGPQDGPSVGEVWPRLRRRVDRARTSRRPLIYLGTKPNGYGNGGEHMHLLLWDYVPVGTLLKHCRQLGIGTPRIEEIRHRNQPALVARPIAYVLGQQEAVFGTAEHERHMPREKYRRRWLRPHRSTLADHNPELLSAIEAAESESVSDRDLILRVPYLSRDSNREDHDQ
jgi:hypothetical protein